jgi:hypothetical protein
MLNFAIGIELECVDLLGVRSKRRNFNAKEVCFHAQRDNKIKMAVYNQINSKIAVIKWINFYLLCFRCHLSVFPASFKCTHAYVEKDPAIAGLQHDESGGYE